MSAPAYPLHTSGFLVHVKVGQHRDDQYFYLDKGSSLLWIHCLPDSLNAKNPVYDSRNSSTYKAKDCTSHFCDAYYLKCDMFHRCQYDQRYAKGMKTKGHLAQETFVFGGIDSSLFGKDEVILNGIVFGCSNATQLLSDGILGFCYNTYSLLDQNSSTKFSYCLGDIIDTCHDYSRLIIDKPIKEHLTHEIPLIVDGKYYVDMIAIQIGHVILDIEIGILKRNTTEHKGGMAVDTVSTFSFFPEVVYNLFVVAIKKLIDDLSLDRYYHKPSMLCYKGSFRRDLTEFLIVRLWFGKKSLYRVSD
ncbi:aspartic proteinase nepenthesin-1-like [Primulina huaijiensis]|uniref:aspartic proteinase nepenthesin-1-like n=1 Tax=Primulina huaijiensis TaxID=1492673 RepID=UPI003CC74194